MSFEDFDEFAQDVQTKMEKVWDDIQSELTRMAETLNSVAGKFDWGYVLFPIPKLIIDGLTSDDVEKAIDKFNNEIRPQIEKKVQEITADMDKVVSSMAGNPVALKTLSFDYADCKAKLLYQAPSIDSEIQELGKTWKGEAYESYALAAREQVRAMTDIASGMESAADMVNLAAQKILQLWVDLADTIIKGLTAVIRLLGDGTSVEKILSLEVPVIIKAVADILDFAQDVAKILEDYMIGVGFPDQLAWIKLKNGTAGLNQNQWPVIHPGEVDDLADAGSWTPA